MKKPKHEFKKEYDPDNINSLRKCSMISYGVGICGVIVTLYDMFVLNAGIMQVTGLFGITMCAFIFATYLKIYIAPYLAIELLNNVSIDGLKLDYAPKAGIPEKYFKATNFIRKYDKYQSFDFIVGKIANKDFIMSGIAIRSKTSTTGPDELKTVYQGIFGMMDYISENKVDFIITPDITNKFLNGITEDIKRTLGENKKIVRMENSEFERLYEVYADDQIATRKVITPAFMEKMVEFRKLVNKPVSLIYKGNKIYFFVENKFIINASKLYFKGVNETNKKEVQEFLEKLTEIVDTLGSEV